MRIALQPGQARVLWFNFARCIGMAETYDGVEAIILSHCVPQNGTRFRFLEAGQIIRFTKLVEQKGEGQCPFRLEGISLLQAA